ncbi:MAG TPA: glycosyltransferase, partial [Ktedonobacterales bacterium]|nr:glycosyltransferase [Ktedonobacterales bacterium]
TFSALFTLTAGQCVCALLLAATVVTLLIRFPWPSLIVLIALISAIYAGDLVLSFIIAARALDTPIDGGIDDKVVSVIGNVPWPSYTILCPLYHEPEVVPQFVEAMKAMEYPADKLQILLLTEDDDQGLRDSIAGIELPPHFSVVTVPKGKPRTKPRACNYGLLQATGDFVVIYDAEDIPEPLQLKKAVLTFAMLERQQPQNKIACVQAKLNFYNVRQNILTRWFAAEYSLWFDLTLPGLQSLGMPLPLGGTSNHFCADLLRQVGAWDAFNVTEDCELGLRLARHGLKTAMLNSTTYEEANSRPRNWLRQRSRWIKGYLQTYLVYLRQPGYYLRSRHWKEFFALQLAVGGKAAVVLINPLMWVLIAIYVAYHHDPAVFDLFHVLFPSVVLYLAAGCLIFGNFLYIYMHFIGCLKRNQIHLMKWVVFIPIYWLMMSVAGYIGLFQLIFRPHFWEKTKHGLHLRAPQKALDEGVLTVSPKTAQVSIAVPPPPELGPGTRELLIVRELHELAQRFTTIRAGAKPPRQRDPWLTSTLLATYIASLVTFLYYFQHHQTVIYGDAYAHMLIARRVFENATPGVAQLGAVWLPLPHLLMVPFVWNNYLWQTGLAGTIPSMICFYVAALFVFLAARRLTHNSAASYVGALLFILNPNVLYLQTTALTEIALAAT